LFYIRNENYKNKKYLKGLSIKINNKNNICREFSTKKKKQAAKIPKMKNLLQKLLQKLF
jgi:hypothetical protein